MVVEKWTGWAVVSEILQVVDQILSETWLVEQVWQDEHGINAEFLSVFSQVVHVSDRCTTDLHNAVQLVLAAHLEPFFGKTFAFVHAQSGAFTSVAVDQNGGDALLLQVQSVLLDDIVVDGALPIFAAREK